jgi:hypothetical protein
MVSTSYQDSLDFPNLVGNISNESIYTTVIGIGMDLASTIIEKVSATSGANYANVRSTQNFNELMKNEFGEFSFL